MRKSVLATAVNFMLILLLCCKRLECVKSKNSQDYFYGNLPVILMATYNRNSEIVKIAISCLSLLLRKDLKNTLSDKSSVWVSCSH
jgi:hypothetical protein